MKIIALNEDRPCTILVDKDIRTFIRHFDQRTNEMVVTMGSIVLRISKKEITNLYNTGLKLK